MAKSDPTPIYPVHVICCNDAVMFVVIGGTEAQARDRIEVEALRDWETGYKWKYPEYKKYRSRMYWRAHIVNGEIHDPL